MDAYWITVYCKLHTYISFLFYISIGLTSLHFLMFLMFPIGVSENKENERFSKINLKFLYLSAIALIIFGTTYLFMPSISDLKFMGVT